MCSATVGQEQHSGTSRPSPTTASRFGAVVNPPTAALIFFMGLADNIEFFAGRSFSVSFFQSPSSSFLAWAFYGLGRPQVRMQSDQQYKGRVFGGV